MRSPKGSSRKTKQNPLVYLFQCNNTNTFFRVIYYYLSHYEFNLEKKNVQTICIFGNTCFLFSNIVPFPTMTPTLLPSFLYAQNAQLLQSHPCPYYFQVNTALLNTSEILLFLIIFSPSAHLCHSPHLLVSPGRT